MTDTQRFHEYHIAGDEGYISPDGSITWEPTIKVTGTETVNGKEYVRDIAWFTPDDYGMEYAELFMQAVQEQANRDNQ